MRALPELDGRDALELGCGTAYFSAWLARHGARPVGLDVSENQLASARRLQAEHGVDFPLVHASAEDVPLASGSFDLVVSEYGASLWCEPEAWLAEASRLLRPDGHLVFLTNSLLVALCVPDRGAASDRLVRNQAGLRTLTYPDDDGIEFHLSHGDWIDALRRHGFSVRALHELYAPEDDTTPRLEWITPEWARRWPVEEIWAAQRTPA